MSQSGALGVLINQSDYNRIVIFDIVRDYYCIFS